MIRIRFDFAKIQRIFGLTKKIVVRNKKDARYSIVAGTFLLLVA
jgi:hypothetical protein